MAVYVEAAKQSCHGRPAYLMTADTADEFREMAHFLSLPATACRAFNESQQKTHFLLAQSKMNEALLFGAVER